MLKKFIFIHILQTIHTYDTVYKQCNPHNLRDGFQLRIRSKYKYSSKLNALI